MLWLKEAHGSGTDLEFPTEDQIQEHMRGQPSEFMVTVYGDGSLTSPTKWWASLGGMGVWIKDWQHEKDISHAAIGQTGSSTRQELSAWLGAGH